MQPQLGTTHARGECGGLMRPQPSGGLWTTRSVDAMRTALGVIPHQDRPSVNRVPGAIKPGEAQCLPPEAQWAQ